MQKIIILFLYSGNWRFCFWLWLWRYYGMINSRCIKGVLSESDYNQTWIVHNAMSEALERLLLTHFLTEVSGVNMFTASNRTSGHISSMIKGVEYHISQSKVKVQHRALENENSCMGKFNTTKLWKKWMAFTVPRRNTNLFVHPKSWWAKNWLQKW